MHCSALRRAHLYVWLAALLCLPAAHAQTPSSAEVVLGQVTFTTREAGTSATQFNGPNGVAIDPVSGKLFVADRGNHRVLRFGSAADLQSGAAAEAVFGQDDFTSKASGAAANRFNNPIGVHLDSAGRLWVADFSNNRILRFDDAAGKPSGADADGVLGQPDFTTTASGSGADRMRGPVTVFVDAQGRLWMTDFSNHRVLRFDDAAGKADGAAADGVLGQPDFATVSSGLSETKMASPNAAFVDAGGRLWVADNGNYRVLRFDDAASRPSGAPADGVLGQPDFTTKTASITQSGMGTLRFVFGDAAGRLYVLQENSHRLTIYEDAASKPDGAPADFVIGQPDFITGTAANPPTAASFNTPRALFIDEASQQMWVADWSNNRVLRFQQPGAGGEHSLALLEPAGGESYAAGAAVTVRWASTGVDRIVISYSADDGTTWAAVDTVDAATGQYEWSAPSVYTTSARLRLHDLEDEVVQATSGAFSIVAPRYEVTLVSPNGYQQWEAGSTRRILFTARDVSTVDLAFSLDDGQTWNDIAEGLDASSGSYAWATPEVVSAQVRVRVAAGDDATVADVSAAPFSLVAPDAKAGQPFIFFDDSPSGGVRDASYGFANAPSLLDHRNSKLPLSPDVSFSGTYSVRLAWTSSAGGDWGAAIAGTGWVGRDVTTKDTLEMRVFTEETIPAADLPLVYLEDLSNRKTGRIELAETGSAWEARTWTHVKIPISAFSAVAGTADLTRIKTVFFGQDAADGQPHVAYIGDLRMTGGRVIDGDLANVIVVLGSSTAAGTGATSTDSSWVGRFRRAVLQDDPDAYVVNLAVGGYTTYDVLPTGTATPSGRPAPRPENNITAALSYNPDAIIVNLPSNDAAIGASVREQTDNLRAIAAAASARGVRLWVTTTQPRNFAEAPRRQNLMDVRDSIHVAFGERAIDVWTGLATAGGTIEPRFDAGDGIHLNNAGHRYIYEQVMAAGVWSTVVPTAPAETTAGLLLEPNAPNPASTHTTIRFQLPRAGHVRLELFDLLGRRVAHLHEGALGAGWHAVEVDAGALPSGIYLYRLTGDGASEARRMVVAR